MAHQVHTTENKHWIQRNNTTYRTPFSGLFFLSCTLGGPGGQGVLLGQPVASQLSAAAKVHSYHLESSMQHQLGRTAKLHQCLHALNCSKLLVEDQLNNLHPYDAIGTVTLSDSTKQGFWTQATENDCSFALLAKCRFNTERGPAPFASSLDSPTHPCVARACVPTRIRACNQARQMRSH